MLIISQSATHKYAVVFTHGEGPVQLPSGKTVERKYTTAALVLSRTDNVPMEIGSAKMIVNPKRGTLSERDRCKEALGVLLRDRVIKAQRSVFWEAFFKEWPVQWRRGKKEKRYVDDMESHYIGVWLARSGSEYDDWDWDGETLVVLLNEKVRERYNRQTLIEQGVIYGI